MIKNVLFIVPPHLTFDGFINPSEHFTRTCIKNGKTFGHIITDTPLGCLSMSSYIKKTHNVCTSLIDFNTILHDLESFDYNDFTEMFNEHLSDLSTIPDIICISTLFITAYSSTMDIVSCCRKLYPKSIILLGGGVPTNMYQQILINNTDIDAICYGEGEIPLDNFLTTNTFAHDSWITREKLNNNFIPSYSFIKNLDELPFFDYDILSLSKYTTTSMKSFKMINIDNKKIHYITSFGCCNRCTFCASSTVHGRKVRGFSIERVKQDLNKLKDMGMETIIFQDDHFLYDINRSKTIIKYMIAIGLKPLFQNALAMYAIDYELLTLLKEAGIEMITLPIESGSEKVLQKIMRKPLNRKIIKNVVQQCRSLGIYTAANVIFGLPGETKEDINDSVNFLKTIGVNWYMIFTFSPLIGSHLYKVCVENNYIDTFAEIADYKNPIVTTKDFDPAYIRQKIYEINLELNFIYNYDIANNDYGNAIMGLLNVLTVKPEHSLAHYLLAKCYKSIDNQDLYLKHKNMCYTTLKKDGFWKNIFNKYKIDITSI